MRSATWIVVLSLTGVMGQALAEPSALRAHQRLVYVQAEQALGAHEWGLFDRLAQDDRDYVLYPYLHFEGLIARIDAVTPAAAQQFLADPANHPLAGRFRRAYLRAVAKTGAWTQFAQFYQGPGDHLSLRCDHWRALSLAGRAHDAVSAKASALWSEEGPLPPACVAFYRLWLPSQPARSALVWARVRIDMRNGRLAHALALRPWLDSGDRLWLDRWVAMARHPVASLAHVSFPVNSARARRVVVTGVIALGGRDPRVAMHEWQMLESRDVFFGTDNNRVLRHLGVAAAADHLPEAVDWLANAVPTDHDRLQIPEWRVRAALWTGDWARVATFIKALPPKDQSMPEWRYWQARALVHLGHAHAAHVIYRKLATLRNFYGFLAADRLHLPYRLHDAETVPSRALLIALAKRPDVAIAHELFSVGDIDNARRAWATALAALPHDRLAAAAVLALHWDWYDRAIATTNAAGEDNAIALRFPIAYYNLVQKYANANAIDPGWVYGVMRQESAFVVDARSRTGALGLMQLMPATGRRTARLLQFRLPATSAILNVHYNVQLGSRYLRRVLNRNDQNTVLATASYNAGPARVALWRPQSRPRSADVWIDTIPFDETRHYVKNVLAFTVVYDRLLGHPTRRLSDDLTPITPAPSPLGPGAATMIPTVSVTTLPGPG